VHFEESIFNIFPFLFRITDLKNVTPCDISAGKDILDFDERCLTVRSTKLSQIIKKGKTIAAADSFKNILRFILMVATFYSLKSVTSRKETK
jgi:hypothetical protein